MSAAEAPFAPLGAYSTPGRHASIKITHYETECTTLRFLSLTVLSKSLAIKFRKFFSKKVFNEGHDFEIKSATRQSIVFWRHKYIKKTHET